MAKMEEYDVYYGQSVHWICVGDKETGNPTLVHKKHYVEILSDSQREEAKLLAAGLVVKYWKGIALDVKIYTTPHPHIIIAEEINELPHKH